MQRFRRFRLPQRVRVPRVAIPRGIPAWVPRTALRLQELDTRYYTVIVICVALALLVASVFVLNLFRQQRLTAQRNNTLLSSWNIQLLTATPAALERDRLQQQLGVVQARFAEASGRLPGTNVEAAVLQRITEAAERSGVTLTALQQVGEPFQEGSLVGWRYEVGATGDLNRLTEFTTRLEEEAFPAAYVSDPTLSANADGEYVMAAELTVFGSTLSTNPLVQTTPLSPEQLSAQLRADAATALANGDYELALSQLLRVLALEPDAADVDDLLYDTYVAYGDQLLAQNRPEIAQDQYEAALAINPNGPEATRGLLEVAQLVTPTPGGVVVVLSPTPSATQGAGNPPDGGYPPPASVTSGVPASPTTRTGTATVDSPPTNAPPPSATRSPTSRVPSPTAGLPPTIAPPPQPASRTPTRQPSSPPPPTVTWTRTTTASPGPSPTSTNTGTPGPSPTRTNTPSPGPSPTSTNTGTPGPSPTPGTPAPSNPPSSTTGPPTGIAFGPLEPYYLPNCGVTQIKGTIRDAGNGAPINNAQVRVWWDGAGPDEIYSRPSGSDTSLGAGGYDVVLWPGPREGKWYVAVADSGSGLLLSDVKTVQTDTGPCRPGESGHQVVIQDFNKFGSGPGEVVATPTPGPSRTPTVTGTVSVTPTPSITGTRTSTPTLTVTGTRSATATSTATGSATATASPTQTPTPSPSPTPVVYNRNEDPDRPIPDGPEGTISSDIEVTTPTIVRELRVLPNILHDDVGDLVIDLLHPDGTSIRLHNRGENAGQTSLRSVITITGSDLARIQGRSAQGEWTLRITDTIEGQTGELLSWSLEIYP